MTASPRFLFDECLSRLAVAQLRLDIPNCPELAHLTTFFAEGTKDQEWIPRLAEEGGWVVVTSDRGIKSRKLEKLPRLCVEFGLTHVLFSASLHVQPTLGKLNALKHVWMSLMSVGEAPPGSRFLLHLRSRRGGGHVPALRFVPIK